MSSTALLFPLDHPTKCLAGLSQVGFSARLHLPARSTITSDSSHWNEELLRLELGDLQSAGFDLALTGFDQNELLMPSSFGSLEPAVAGDQHAVLRGQGPALSNRTRAATPGSARSARARECGHCAGLW
jgi:hypothetical protein